MKNGPEIPRPVVVVVIIVVVVLIGFIGRKAIMGPQRVQMSPDAVRGMKEHMAGQGSGGAPSTGPGMGSKEHSK